MTFDLRQIHTVYADLRLKAHRLLAGERAGHTLQPTALLNEYLIKLFKTPDWEQIAWRDRDEFFRVATASMRNVLKDYARRRAAGKRPDGKRRVDIEDVTALTEDRVEELIQLEELLDQLEVAAETRNSHQISLAIRLHVYGGCDGREIAQWLGVTERRASDFIDYGMAWIQRRGET